MTAPLDLRAVEARLKAATPGPWEAGTLEVWVKQTPTVRQLITSLVEGPSRFNYPDKGFEHNDSGHNTEFIAHAPEDVAALLAHCRALRAALGKTATYNRVMPQDIDEARDVLAQATDQEGP